MAMFRFEDNDVVLPITIIEELDRFKKGTVDTARNARYVSRTLDELRAHGSSPMVFPSIMVAILKWLSATAIPCCNCLRN